MLTVAIALVLLVAGYFVCAAFVEKCFGYDPARETPAVRQEDGVDFIALPGWRIFMNQFLNIAGWLP